MRKLFGIRKDERIEAVAAAVVIIALQVLMIQKFFVLFADYDMDSWRVFMRNFHMSGFDPMIYRIVSEWQIGYNIIRHPLLPFLLAIPYAINQVLWAITGMNCAQFVVGILLVTCAFYAFIFLLRIFREVIGVARLDAALLASYCFGFAYVMLTVMVPDHFCLSMPILLLAIYLAGKKIRANETFSIRQSALLVTLAAGVTLTNGAIVALAIWVTNKKATFKPRFLFSAIIVPLLLLIGWAVAYNAFTTLPQDEAVVSWIDTTTPRLQTLVENFFGETIQLHRSHILGDVLVRRPIFVAYSWQVQYAIEGVIVLLFVLGLWKGRRDRFDWLVFGCFLMAIALHICIGFAITEPYIMAAHWVWTIPMATAYLLTTRNIPLRLIITALTLYLWYLSCSASLALYDVAAGDRLTN